MSGALYRVGLGTLGIVAFLGAAVAGVAGGLQPVVVSSRGADSLSTAASAAGKRGWLPALFAPAVADKREDARAHLEAVGLKLEGEAFLEAVRSGHRPLINLFRQAGMDVNAEGRAGRTALLTAVLQKDWALMGELLKAGADANKADEAGLTPLMAVAAMDDAGNLKVLLEAKAQVETADGQGHKALHYAVAAGAVKALKVLFERGAKCEGGCCEGRDLLDHAFAGQSAEIVQAVLEHEEKPLAWRASSRTALEAALAKKDAARVKLLLSKHDGPPTLEGKAQPLLAYLVVQDKLDAFKMLLEAGLDANTPLNSPVEKEFNESVKGGYLRHYLAEEQGMTVLMLAAGMGKTEYVKALLEKGAKRWTATAKYKMPAMSFAAVTESADIMQMLIGDCPKPEDLRIEVSLSAQRATVYKNGVAAITTAVSTGKTGFKTATGRFVVTDKHQDHKSTIYKAPMPYFMRLNCRDFGMHSGVVPGYPASHGCIRVPDSMAKRLFKEIPVGTLVTIE